MILTSNRFFASFILFLFLAVGLEINGLIGSIIMLYGAKFALLLWFLPQIKNLLAVFKEWRLRKGLKTWKEFKQELRET